MLRIATPEDLDLVVSMAMKFLASSNYKDMGDEEKIRAFAEKMLQGDGSMQIILLHGDSGMLAGSVSPFLFGNKVMASELAWWVDEDKRGTRIGAELLEAFEFWAKHVGCDHIVMISLDDNLGKYYEKNGYFLIERSYMKEI